MYYDSCATSSLLISRLPAVFSPVFILLGNGVFEQTNFSWEASSSSDPLFFGVALGLFSVLQTVLFCFPFWDKGFLKKKRAAQILSELEAVEEKLNISTKKRIHFLANINPSSDEFS